MTLSEKQKEKIDKVKELVDTAQHITVLTGAGVSTESGIPDFKTMDEHWGYPISRQEILSSDFFEKNPAEFWYIFKQEFAKKMNAQPSSFHQYIASLENEQRQVTVITQNIDQLHQMAGSSQVFPVHGNIANSFCTNDDCGLGYSTWEIAELEGTPHCAKCFSVLKPDVTLFGEQLAVDMQQLFVELWTCDLLIVAGTSLEVAPVNYIPEIITREQPHTSRVWLNTNAPPLTEFGVNRYAFHHKILAPLGEFTDYIK